MAVRVNVRLNTNLYCDDRPVQWGTKQDQQREHNRGCGCYCNGSILESLVLLSEVRRLQETNSQTNTLAGMGGLLTLVPSTTFSGALLEVPEGSLDSDFSGSEALCHILKEPAPHPIKTSEPAHNQNKVRAGESVKGVRNGC
jgi:hypothetical protein